MQVLRAKLLVFLVVGSQCAAFNCTQSDVGNFSKANDVLVLGHKNISVLDNTTLDSCANLTNKERIRYLDFSCASLLCRAGACSPDHCWLPVTPGHTLRTGMEKGTIKDIKPQAFSTLRSLGFSNITGGAPIIHCHAHAWSRSHCPTPAQSCDLLPVSQQRVRASATILRTTQTLCCV